MTVPPGYRTGFVPASARFRGEATSNQTLPRKKRQRHQGIQTAKNDTKREECPECIARCAGAVLDFPIVPIVWKENDRRDAHGRAECNAMRDQMPPANMVIAPEMLVAQATTVWLVETKDANFDTLRSILTFENEVRYVRSLLNYEIFATMNQKRAISVLGALCPGIVVIRGWFARGGAAATS